MIDELVTIESKGAATLRGRVIGVNGKLGQYIVVYRGELYGPYAHYSEAEKVFKKVTAPKVHSENENGLK